VDFASLDSSIPHLTLSSSIGNGLSFVSKFMTSKLNGKVENAQPLVDYLLSLNHQGEVWERKNFDSFKKILSIKIC
jgi:sucrose synthase